MWLVGFMQTVGIFEAKTKFTGLCEQVASSGQSVVVSKRGRPMVMLAPVPPNLQSERPDILTAWREWSASDEGLEEEFPEVWKFRGRTKGSPLAE
jgi:prevent-host-death family protein